MLTVFVISMLNDTERRKNISEKFGKYNIDFFFIDAVVGKELSDEYLSKLEVTGVKKRKKRNITPGEIGCTLSHVKAYKKIIDLNIAKALIVEDDIHFDHRLGLFIENYKNASNLDSNDIYMLGGQNGINSSRYISRSIWGKKIIGEQCFYKTIKSEAYIYRTCCYVISREIAEKLYYLSHSEFFIADEWSYFKDVNAINYIYLSDFVDHPKDLTASHIEQERVDSSITVNDNKNKLKKILKKYFFALEIYNELIYIRAILRRLYK